MGLFTAIFGGSRSKQQSTSSSTSNSSSYNQAYPWLQETYAPQAQSGIDASNAVSSLLGLKSPGAFDAAYRQFQDSTGFQDRLNTGMRAVTGSQAVGGQLGSGKTLKALTTFGQNLSDQSFGDYLSRLLGLSENGIKQSALVASAGNVSNSSSTSNSTSSGKSSSDTGALGSFLGGLLASDPRLKENVVYLGDNKGLAVYSYNYVWDDTPQIGYMADEVAEKRPDALGPLIGGKYLTLDYSKLPQIKEGR